MAKTATTTADRLKALKSGAKVKDTAPKKNELRVIDFTDSPSGKKIASLCELSYLVDQFAPFIEQNKIAVQDFFFEFWTQEMWDAKKLSDNFKARMKKDDGTFDDMSCNFIMKFRVDGLAKKLPKAGNLAEEVTVHEILVQTLLSVVVGLTPDNAHKFCQEEFEVEESTGFPEGGLEKMLSAKEGTDSRIIGDYILACLTAKTKKERDSLPLLTPFQSGMSVEINQKYTVKKGLEERILSYVESLEQLRNLLKFLSVTKQVSNFEFGISDEVEERNRRLTEIAGRFISFTDLTE